MLKVIFKYFLDVNLFNFIYSFVLGILFFNYIYIPFIFSTIGTFFGILSFKYFYSNEYYFYHNLGFTELRLNMTVLFFNVFISIFVFAIYYLVK